LALSLSLSRFFLFSPFLPPSLPCARLPLPIFSMRVFEWEVACVFLSKKHVFIAFRGVVCA
jgi:hypothetical protein